MFAWACFLLRKFSRQYNCVYFIIFIFSSFFFILSWTFSSSPPTGTFEEGTNVNYSFLHLTHSLGTYWIVFVHFLFVLVTYGNQSD